LTDSEVEYDVAIVGGGPAGLSAGIIASYKGLKTIVFEGGTWGGLLSTIYPYKHVFNYPGTPKVLATHLVAEWVRQAADLGVLLVKERVTEITKKLQVLAEFYPKHIEKEDKVFFPASRAYLTDEEDREMLEEFWKFDQNMIHEKYRSVVERLETE